MDIDVSKLQKQMSGGSSWDDDRRKGANKKKFNKNTNKFSNKNFNKQGQYTYVGSPFNFVPFSDKVYEYPDGKLTAHSDMKPDLFTGEIEYEITARTPIFVDDGKGEFHKDAYGRYSIPGSTMRGLIRSNAQILGLSSFYDDIDDYTLMYRNVAAGLQQKRYNEILGQSQINKGKDKKGRPVRVSVLRNVKAGYLKNENGKYYIYQTKVRKIDNDSGKRNYYILRDAAAEINKKDYSPYMRPVSYKLKGVKDVEKVGNPGQLPLKGYVVSSGKMSNKKVRYIIPEINENEERISVPTEDIRAFEIDYKQRENKLPDRDRSGFFKLPQNGECKPVFYIYLNGRLYFGFTPRLRLFYDHSIKEGLSKNHRADSIDYCKAIFGYSNDQGSYKSKVSFTDAVAVSKVYPGEEEQVILSEPKPTSCLEYVKPQNGKPATYNDDNFELRGVKQYWLHQSHKPASADEKQKNVASALKPLPANVHFRGKVRFQNLKEDELGLLLWAICLNENSWMNVGKGKPYGYGTIDVNVLNVRLMDMEKAYSKNIFDMYPFKDADIKPLIQAYKDKIQKFLNGRAIDDLPHIQEFFAMKDSSAIPDHEKTRYMTLDEFKGQMRSKRVLPSVRDMTK